MKGTIVKCLEELVTSQFSQEVWEKSLQDAGISESTVFWPMGNVDDLQVMDIITAVCTNLGITFEQAADAFGDYWVNVYSQRMYPLYYQRNPTARDFLLHLDQVHTEMTQRMEDASPPRFEYEWVNDNTLIMHYHSHRDLVDFVVGLARGVGKHYGEPLQVSKVGPDKVMVGFAAQQ